MAVCTRPRAWFPLGRRALGGVRARDCLQSQRWGGASGPISFNRSHMFSESDWLTRQTDSISTAPMGRSDTRQLSRSLFICFSPLSAPPHPPLSRMQSGSISLTGVIQSFISPLPSLPLSLAPSLLPVLTHACTHIQRTVHTVHPHTSLHTKTHNSDV